MKVTVLKTLKSLKPTEHMYSSACSSTVKVQVGGDAGFSLCGG